MKPILFAAALLLTACATTSTPSGGEKAQIGTFGVDLDGRDLTVKPGDDFAEYAGGGWMKANQIPPDRSRWGMFDQLRAQAEEDVRAIVQETAAQQHASGSIGQKIGDFYNAYLDTAAIDARELEPARDGLAAIDALRTHAQVAALISRPGFPVNGPLAAYIDLDDKNPDRYIVGITHAGLSLPEREYYLKDTAEFREIRAKFTAHVARLLTLAGQINAQAKARQILALETQIARNHWNIAKRRERDLTYNLLSVDQLKQTAPDYPWTESLASAGLAGEKEVIVRELSAIEPLARLFRQTPVGVWKTYLTYSYLRSCADVLPKALDDEVFDFYGRTLNGQPQQRDRWKRAVNALDRSLGEGVGQLYVAKHFPPGSKAKMAALVENLRKGYGERIKAVPWMSEETKAEALKKLATFRPKIGYPDKWRDYSPLEVRAGDAFGNKQRSAEYEWNRDVQRLGKKSDRDEWFMTPQTVNAYYNPTFNEVVFPAAILQPPFFDPYADDAVNYGAVGGVIGHEMGHGFDDQGAKSDADGVLRNWWKKEDEDAFKARTDSLAAQYSEFEPLPGLNINGRLTLGENIGDLGGLTVAHKAYELSLKGKPAKAIDGYSGDHRFFLAWAQVWRTLTRDQALRNQLLTDPHSPGLYRANGVVRNMDQWYAAFGVQPGDKLYVPPEKRVRIW